MQLATDRGHVGPQHQLLQQRLRPLHREQVALRGRDVSRQLRRKFVALAAQVTRRLLHAPLQDLVEHSNLGLLHGDFVLLVLQLFSKLEHLTQEERAIAERKLVLDGATHLLHHQFDVFERFLQVVVGTEAERLDSGRGRGIARHDDAGAVGLQIPKPGDQLQSTLFIPIQEILSHCAFHIRSFPAPDGAAAKKPSISVSASPAVLWPPNHKLVSIAIARTATDACDPHPAIACTATSSEPADGSKGPDFVWSGDQLSLRSERLGNGPGRTYTCTATDASGNAQSAVATVTVPHDQR